MVTRAPYKITISDDARLGSSACQLLGRAVRVTLREHGVKEARIGLALLSDPEMAALNEERLGHAGPTDVLTFDLHEHADCLEGEIAMSVETAGRQALQRGHSVKAELALYAVHGVLHLLGYDDKDPVEADKMHAMEDTILQLVGLGTVFSKT